METTEEKKIFDLTFYLCNNELLTISYTTSENIEQATSIFRVENVSNNCVTLRLLQEQDDGTYTNKLVAEKVTFLTGKHKDVEE